MPNSTVLAIFCSFAILLAQILISFYIYEKFGEHETHNFEKNSFIYVCIILEFIFNIFGMILVLFWAKILRKPSVIHWNLKIACLGECICIFIVCLTRLLIEMDELYNGLFLSKKFRFIIKIVHDTTNYQYFIIHACIAIERSLATFFVNIYENIGKQKCWIIFMFCMGLTSIPCHVIPRYILKDYFILVYFVISLEIIVGIVCILLFRINTKSYRNPIHPELTARYQTMENIKNLKQILIFILFGLIHNIVVVAFAILVFILWIPAGKQNYIINLNAVWNLLNGIFAVLYPLIFIFDFKRFKRMTLSLLMPCRKSQKISPYLEQQPYSEKRTFKNNDQDDHFRELKRIWDTVL